MLNGSASSGDIQGIRWVVPGVALRMMDDDSLTPLFEVPEGVGDKLVIVLELTDSNGVVATDRVTVRVED